MEDDSFWILYFKSPPAASSGLCLFKIIYFPLVRPIACFHTTMFSLFISIIPESSSNIQLRYHLHSVDKSIVNHFCIQNTLYKIFLMALVTLYFILVYIVPPLLKQNVLKSQNYTYFIFVEPNFGLTVGRVGYDK